MLNRVIIFLMFMTIPLVSMEMEIKQNSKIREEQQEQKLISLAAVGDIQGVQQLLEAGTDMNARDTEGNTPLMRAMGNDHFEIVKLIVQHYEFLRCQALKHDGEPPIDPRTIVNYRGETAVGFARRVNRNSPYVFGSAVNVVTIKNYKSV